MDGFDDEDDDLFLNLPLDQINGEDSAKNSAQGHDIPAAPEEFPFPFTPYDIQVGFMQQLYRALDGGKIGIFESPTGTGKSLSLICGALTWLRDYEEQQRKELEKLLEAENRLKEIQEKENAGENELDWITAYAKKKELDEQAEQLKQEQESRVRREKKLQEVRANSRPKAKRKRDKLEEEFDELFKDASQAVKDKLQTELQQAQDQAGGEDDDRNIVLDEYHSEDEDKKDPDSTEGDDDEQHVTKVYFCSRTHSQLSQFVKEVMKSPFGSDTRVISLGSRQNLCVNEAVMKLRSLSLINDRCLEMQKNKSASREKTEEKKRRKMGGGCPFYKQELLLDYRDKALAAVQDIEQLVTVGRKMKACPYYGTRFAIPAAQIVALPYNTLLHKSTRDSCGIKLKGNVVIIDEAHNLVETISNVYSVEVTGSQVTCAHSQLSQYKTRYQSRLKAKNLMYIQQILFILKHLIKYLGGEPGIPAEQQAIKKNETRLQTINDFLFATQLDNMNLFKIMRYCERSLISRKLHGFVEKYQSSVQTAESKKEETVKSGLSRFLQEIKDGTAGAASKNTEPAVEEDRRTSQASFSSPLMHIEGFLQALTNANKDGRIVVNKQGLLSKSSLKFLLLNPAVHFADVISEARAVIVAGGTMKPISEFKDQLFLAAGASPERFIEYSCGHVIPADHILPMAIARGPSGLELDFTYQNRDSPHIKDELGRALANISNLVPGGVVCFFPSYDYERCMYSHWENTGFLNRIQVKKRVFREPKKASQVDQVLSEFSKCIKSSKSTGSSLTGALLLCVVGGKMSEGINFSDDLGRCVVMVGLPYPNLRSPELKEKMDYLNATQPKSPDGKLPGQVHYENLCMKAVNQSIGRAIRHKGDYASILLLDQRYLRPNIQKQLPGWISSHLVNQDKFGPALASLGKFYAQKQR